MRDTILSLPITEGSAKVRKETEIDFLFGKSPTVFWVRLSVVLRKQSIHILRFKKYVTFLAVSKIPKHSMIQQSGFAS